MSKNIALHGYWREDDIEKVLERAGVEMRGKIKIPDKKKVWKKIKKKIDEK